MIQLRFSEPEPRGPFRVPLNVNVRGVEVPVPSVVGALATFASGSPRWRRTRRARYVGPRWLRSGSSSTRSCAASAARGCSSTSSRRTSRSSREATFASILVPMKLGDIGEEMVATAVKLAQERGRASTRCT